MRSVPARCRLRPLPFLRGAFLLAPWTWLVAFSTALAGSPLDPGSYGAEPVDYVRQVKPILKQRCYACHGALKRKAGLRLDTAASLRRGGDGGPAIEVGRGAESLLIDRVAEEDAKLRMPPEGPPLSAEQVAILRAWIDQGVNAPADERPEEDPRRHWAFRKPVRPPVPAAKDGSRVRNPIDAFLAVERERRGLKPLPPAWPEVLLRRVYLDLIGLPPSREELLAFLVDPSDAAYEQTVDRLLASPRHGERWARHWMDVWRYSDWYGRRAVPDVLNSYAMIWRWRDWIVRSLNRDDGYDLMVRRMLAADELEPADDANLVATGFIVRNFFRWNYNTWMKDNVEHTAKAFLGLTVQCAHCHDHKYDPITQDDYFALRACFEPIEIRHDRVPGEPAPGPFPKYDYGKAYGPITSGMVRVFDEKLDAKTFLYTRGESRNVVPGKPPIAPGVPAFLNGRAFHAEPVSLPPEVYYPGLKDFVRREELRKCAEDVARCEEALSGTAEDRTLKEAELARARAGLAAIQARIAADRVRFGKEPGDASALCRAASKAERAAALAAARADLARAERDVADARKKASSSELAKAEKHRTAARQAVEAATAAAVKPSDQYTPLSPIYPSRSTGRRAALARWITSPDNPLFARVAVNHLWRWHFNQPIVASTHEFGRNGKRPTHPELLDWLAAELVSRGWSMKAMHRLVVTSDAYRMASHSSDRDDPNLAIDPENHAYWRFTPARMESEVVRDSLLQVAGALDPALGGPDIDFNQGFTSRRRSLYLTHQGEGRMPFLELFDAPDACEAYTRTVSVIPQQALALTNNELARALSRDLARRLWGESSAGRGSCGIEVSSRSAGASPSRSEPQGPEFIAVAFEQVLNRAPSSSELELSLAFLRKQEQLLTRLGPGASSRAREDLVHALFNHNDFLTVH
jgi:hypothetical protein